MKANFPIEDLEQYVDDAFVADGEALISDSALKNINEIEKGLWSIHFVVLQERFEVEIQLNATRVRAYTCECEVFLKQQVCGHVAAALSALRERRRRLFLDNANQKQHNLQKAAAEKAEKGTRITIPSILKNIDHESLVHFLSDYSKQNKQFALALKTRFVDDLSEDKQVQENYNTLIENAFKNAQNTRGNITPKGWIELLTIMDTLKTKAQNAATKSELMQTVNIIKVILPFTHKMMRREDAPFNKLVRRHERFLQTLQEANQLVKAVELKEQIWGFVLQEFKNSLKHEFSKTIFDSVIIKNIHQEKDGDEVLALIAKEMPPPVDPKEKRYSYREIEREVLQQELRNRLTGFQIQLLQKINRKKEVVKLLLEKVQSPNTFWSVIAQAIENNEHQIAHELSEHAFKIYPQDGINAMFEKVLLDYAVADNNTKKIMLHAEGLLLKTFQFSYFQLLKQHFTEKNGTTDKQWAAQLEHILENIAKSRHSGIEKRDLLASIFWEEKQIDKLMLYIEQFNSLELLRYYGARLWEQQPNALFALQRDIIFDFLTNHLGKAPAERIRILLETQLLDGATTLVKDTKQALRKHFVGRLTILEQLTLLETDETEAP